MTITVTSGNEPSQQQLDENPHAKHLWGDNFARFGDEDGAASHCRNRHNTIGLPVKRLPGNGPNSSFTDSDLHSSARGEIDACLYAAEVHLISGGELTWPADLGRSELAGAPALLAYLAQRLEEMTTRYGATCNREDYRAAA